MKPLLIGTAALSVLTVSAFGADLGVPFKAAPIPAPFTWTSCYAGGHVGGGWGQKSLTDPTGFIAGDSGVSSANLNTSGYIAGGQIGCDYQFASNWVLGIEGAASGGNIGGSRPAAQPGAIAGDSATFQQTTDLLTSVTGRVGYGFDHWLLYGKGGAAWASDKYSLTGAFLAVPYDLEGLESRFGWTAGVGIEWAVWDNWSLKLEYDYYGFGSSSVTFNDAINAVTGPASISQTTQVVKLGVNFRIGPDLGWAP
jgi:outer membrane immunogenic protein